MSHSASDSVSQQGLPDVSVVIPVHNGAATLAETVASAFAQSLENIEVLVVDDASADATPEVLRSLEARFGSRLRHWRLGTNGGTSTARNFAISKARAPYIAPLDADDLWHVDKLRRQVEALEAVPEAVASYGWVAHVDSESRYLHEGSHACHEGDVFLTVLLGNFLECGSNILARTDACRAVGGYDESLPSAEDWDFHVRLAFYGPFAVARETLTYYRKHQGSQTLNGLHQIEESALLVTERYYADLRGPEAGLRQSTMANLYRYFLQQVYEGPPAPWRARTGLRFVRQLLRHDPALGRPLGALLLLKSMIRFLPAAWARAVERGASHLPGLETLPDAHHRPINDLQHELPRELRDLPPRIWNSTERQSAGRGLDGEEN